MQAIQVLLRLRASNVKVWAADGMLHCDPPANLLDDELRHQVESCEKQIVEYLVNTDDCEHTTRYIVMRDGVELAADIFRPKRDGVAIAGPLPVIWCHDRYQRSAIADGLLRTKLDTRPWLRAVMRHGYVVGAVDARGSGASTGVRTDEFGEAETWDSYDVTEWFAQQPWCTGHVGMYGDSYLAIAQLLAAGVSPPHLKAIFPQMPLFDLYSFLYPGGVFRRDFVRRWGERVRNLDTGQASAPVAGRHDVVDRAREEHRGNDDVFARAASHPYRDSAEADGRLVYRRSPSSFVDAVNSSRIPVCLLSGWYDLWVRDAIIWFKNLTGPKRLIIGNVAHTEREGIDLEAEHLLWFDHWLKGADMKVTAEPPVRYWTINAPKGREWRTAMDWPPPEAVPTPFYFQQGPSGSVGSVNDGGLGPDVRGPSDGMDEYAVDYTTSSGRSSRWANGYGGDFGYRPMTGNDRKALTYTTEPLPHDLEVTGHPIAHLYVTSTHLDADFFVYLEEVDEAGESHYVTEGVSRTSHRTLGDPPYEYLGLPYPLSQRDSGKDLPSLPVELVLDLHPTSFVFCAGRRIRVTVTCCDRDNADTPVHQPPPVVRVHRRVPHSSYVELPVMPVRQE